MSNNNTFLKSRIKEQHKFPAWAPQGSRNLRLSHKTTAPELPPVADISKKQSRSHPPRNLQKNVPEPAPETPSEEGGPDGLGLPSFREATGSAFLGGIKYAEAPAQVPEKIANRRPQRQPPSKTAQQSEPEPEPKKGAPKKGPPKKGAPKKGQPKKGAPIKGPQPRQPSVVFEKTNPSSISGTREKPPIPPKRKGPPNRPPPAPKKNKKSKRSKRSKRRRKSKRPKSSRRRTR